MQIDEIETWLPFIRPENTSSFGLVKKVEVWDKNRQARHKYTMLIRDNGRVETVRGADIAHTGVDIFDSVHWLKDNLPYCTEPFGQEPEQPRITFRSQRQISEILNSYSNRAVRRSDGVLEVHAVPNGQLSDIEWNPGPMTISGVTTGFAVAVGPPTDEESEGEDEEEEQSVDDEESEDEDDSL